VGYAAGAAYWLAVMAGVKAPLVTHWGFIARSWPHPPR
jgi:hypothetical protein